MTSPKKEASFANGSTTFGEISPWGEPAYCNSLASPYYNESHKRLRAAMREYIDEHIVPFHLEWEAAGGAPRPVAKAWARSGFAFADVPGKYRPKGAGLEKIAGIPVDELDIFHFMVMTDEISRVEGGVIVSCGGATEIGIASIIHHGTEEQKQKWLSGLFSWETSFCIGISEPMAGSDVGNLRTTAKKTGKHYVVNGHKKWISGSPWATHMTAAVRTGGKGMKGISLLVIPLTLPGITIRKITASGQNAGGSSWITLENVQVPIENLIGKENAGFPLIMANFNKERFIMAINCNRKARTCLTHALQYAYDRETFSQPLVAHQIIRHKFSTIARYVESHWAWLEQIAYHIQVNGWQSPDVAGKIALAKVHGGRIIEMAAREGQQVLGGAGYQKGGVGGHIEQITRDLRMFVVGGGSEEILDDLAFREETKRSKQLGSKL